MPRLSHESAVGNLGDYFKSKPDFIKAWEKWRSQITKLDCSPFWIQCDNQQTREGLRNLLQVMLENTEVVLAEISKEFGPWMVAHAVELLTAGSEQTEILLHDERYNLGGISMMKLHQLAYAQVLSSHALTWQIATIYLTSCMKHGMGLLENLLYPQSNRSGTFAMNALDNSFLVGENGTGCGEFRTWDPGKVAIRFLQP